MAGARWEECLPIVRELYRRGVPVREIAARCGGCSVVYRALRELASRGELEPRRGLGTGARLSPEEVEEIMRLRRSGYSIRQIARRLRRAVGTVHRVLRRHGLT